MADSFSHSCPTCGGSGVDVIAIGSGGGVGPITQPCPDCVDGVYPKAGVERAALAVKRAYMETEGDFWTELALAAIRAFHNDGGEG